jgi:hypothetical protein
MFIGVEPLGGFLVFFPRRNRLKPPFLMQGTTYPTKGGRAPKERAGALCPGLSVVIASETGVKVHHLGVGLFDAPVFPRGQGDR